MAGRVVALQFSGEKLQEVRERAGYSRPGLAAKCADMGNSITAQHIGRLEKDECVPQPPTLKALRLALDVDVEALLAGDAGTGAA